MHKRDSLSRRRPSREQFSVYLIVCEGSITEKRYFSDLRHNARIALTLEFITGGVPKTLVEQAVAAKKSKRGYDQIWVVFDVDEHSKLAEAHQQARSNQLKRGPVESLFRNLGAAALPEPDVLLNKTPGPTALQATHAWL